MNNTVCFRRPPPPCQSLPFFLHEHHRQFSSSSTGNTNLRPSPSTTVNFRRPPSPTPICDYRPPPPSSSRFYLFLLNLPPSATAIFTHENFFFPLLFFCSFRILVIQDLWSNNLFVFVIVLAL